MEPLGFPLVRNLGLFSCPWVIAQSVRANTHTKTHEGGLFWGDKYTTYTGSNTQASTRITQTKNTHTQTHMHTHFTFDQSDGSLHLTFFEH